MTNKRKNPACLFLLATHIGNPEDFPKRSLELLTQADLVIFEEDRPARRALKAAGVTRSYLKLTEHGEEDSISAAKSIWKKGGTVTYMSDQGTSSLADPGRDLVISAYEHQVEIKVIPGPSSVTAAISACPFILKSYIYAGFLERKSHLRKRQLDQLKLDKKPVIILDTPYRIESLLDDSMATFGKHHRAMLAIDISGPNESFFCTSIEKVIQHVRKKSIREKKLNFVLILEGKQ